MKTDNSQNETVNTSDIVGEMHYEPVLECNYGENAWQTPATLYATEMPCDPLELKEFVLVAGTSLSYNNLLDLNRLLQTITHIAAAYDVDEGKVPNIAIAVKHGNTCGAGIGSSSREALCRMLEGDPLAIFGGLVMTNFEIGERESASLRLHGMKTNKKRLLDGIIAPSFTDKAMNELKRAKDKCRLLQNPALCFLNRGSLDSNMILRQVRGGFLMQPNYTFILDFKDEDLDATRKLTPAQESSLLLAWAIGSTSNSNTITLVSGGRLIGNGVGQQDRVNCARLAVAKAKLNDHQTTGAVAYSDSFFPFPDGAELLAENGIAAIFASRGSVNDAQVKQSCVDAGVTFVTLPDAKCRGFFGH